MAELRITCPFCGKSITLSEALTHQIEDDISAKIRSEAQETFEKRLEEEIAKYQEELRIVNERAKREVEERLSLELQDLREQIREKNEQLDSSRQQELALRRRQRELEDKQKTLELEIAKRVAEETKNLEQRIAERIAEEHRMKDLEKDKQLNDLRKQIDDLKRKAEQGSQQTQGEVAELEIEDMLEVNFPEDQIEPVGKGIRGADIIQRVFNKSGNLCGTIIWEMKNARRWSDSWISKLRHDQRTAKADIAILVSTVLPKGIIHFSQKEGVWVTEFSFAISLASALRVGLIEVANARVASIGKDEKIENLYAYLAGSEFRQRVEAIVEAFISLKEELDLERRAMEQIWAKREKQLYRAVQGVAGMYGDMKGIIGLTLPKIELLELPAPSISTFTTMDGS